MKKRMFMVAAILGAISTYAGAISVSLEAVADTDIRETVPDYAKGDRDELSCKNAYQGDIIKTYVKFELPANFDYATSASFDVAFSQIYNTLWELKYQIWGLKEGVAGSDWTQLAPGAYTGAPSGGLTWNNAPANNVNDVAGDYYDDFNSDSTGILGSFQRTGAVGDIHSVATQDLVDFINTDADGYVTIMISRYDTGTNAGDKLASIENTTYAPPTLVIDYVPEPATVMLVGLGALVGIRKRR